MPIAPESAERLPAGTDRRLRETSPASPLLLGLHKALSAGELWKSVEHLMRDCIPAHTFHLYLNIPDLARPQALFSTNGFLENLPPETLEASLQASGIIPYLKANPRVKIITVPGIHTDRQRFYRSRHYREFMVPYGWKDYLGMPFWDESMIGFLTLLRSAEEGTFTRGDVSAARRLYPDLSVAVQRVMRASRERSARLGLQVLVREKNPPVVLLSWEGELLFMTRAAREELLRWGRRPEGGVPFSFSQDIQLPREILSGIRGLRARYLEGLRAGHATATARKEIIFHPSLVGLKAEARLLRPGGSGLVMPSLLIEIHRVNTIEKSAPAGSPALLLQTLSTRELAVVELACQGLSNGEIAAKLGRTVGSVKQQLSVIYEKLNVSTRSRLIALYR